jgi:hypothetical protein
MAAIAANIKNVLTISVFSVFARSAGGQLSKAAPLICAMIRLNPRNDEIAFLSKIRL